MPSLVYLWINIAQAPQSASVCVIQKLTSSVRQRASRHSDGAIAAALSAPAMCAYDPWLRCLDTPRLALRASFPNANCLRISNEPLKYRIQWLHPPEAKATGTRARNAAVNESPGRGRGWASFDPGNDFLQIMENFLMKAARQCLFKDLGTVGFIAQTVRANFVRHDTAFSIACIIRYASVWAFFWSIRNF